METFKNGPREKYISEKKRLKDGNVIKIRMMAGKIAQIVLTSCTCRLFVCVCLLVWVK